VSTVAAGLVLTGGASRRLGIDKATLRVGGESLADRTARVLTSVADPVLEVGPGLTRLEVVREAEPGRGPLAAMAAGGAALAARGAGERAVLVLAVDLPALDPALLRLLVAAPPADAVVPRVGGRAQVLCARYSPGALVQAAALVGAGERSVRALLGTGSVAWIDEHEWGRVTTATCFADVDTPEDAHAIGLERPG